MEDKIRQSVKPCNEKGAVIDGILIGIVMGIGMTLVALAVFMP